MRFFSRVAVQQDTWLITQVVESTELAIAQIEAASAV
jgi:hypothetical protein